MRSRPAAASVPAAAVAAAALALTLLLAGCALAARPAAPVAPPSVVGSWRAADTAGKPATLSDLTLRADGSFRYAGRNALGGSVAYGGTYSTVLVGGAPVIRLVYDDFPDKPTLWFYRLAGRQLSVSTVPGNLTNGSALVFTRQ